MGGVSRRGVTKMLVAVPGLALAVPDGADAAARLSRRRLWSGWQQVPGGMMTYSAPAVATYIHPSGDGEFLYLFVRGTNNFIYFNRTDGTSWGGWYPVPGAG